MNATALLNQSDHLATLAKGWLASGASAFGVWSEYFPPIVWSKKNFPQQSSLNAPIYYGSHLLGDIRLFGLDDSQSQERLISEARLIEHLIQVEEEMKTLVADLVDSQDRLLAVYQLARSLRYYTTLDDTLRGLLFESMRLIDVSSGFVIFQTSNSDTIIVQYPENNIDNSCIIQLSSEAKKLGKEFIRNENTSLDVFSKSVTNIAFIPIENRGNIVGGIGLLNKYNGFTTPDIKLAQAIVDQASLHLEQVILQNETIEQRKIQSELELARRIQFRLLPHHTPPVSGLDIMAQSRPARQIGGDFYDFIDLQNRAFMFAVGDVSGKALSAALLMTMTRTAIHSKASYMPNPEPELVMRNSNEDLFDDLLQVGMFATAFIGQYQKESQTIVYANAGHSPVIYCPFGGTPILLGADSPPLGVLKKSLCKNNRILFRPGDLLVVGTDGLNEARGPEEELFGYDRLLHLISVNSHLPACAISDALYSAINTFSAGRPQDDDQTLVVIKGV